MCVNENMKRTLYIKGFAHIAVIAVVGIASLAVSFFVHEEAVRSEQNVTRLEEHMTRLESQVETFGNFNPGAGGTYRLKSSIGTTNTSILLSSFKEPVSDLPITMTSLNSDIGYGTIDPQSSSRKEFVSFTGVTQNSDGSATLTGVTRGLSFFSPFTASSTLRQSHPGQSIFILSDSPQVFEEYAPRRDTARITGDWTVNGQQTYSSTTPPAYDFNPNFSSFATTTFASLGYVNDTATSGAPDASETVKGLVELSTQSEAASSTSAGGTSARLALPASIATSTPDLSTGSSQNNYVVVSDNDGKLKQEWLDLSENFTFTGTTTHNGKLGVGTSTPFGNSTVAIEQDGVLSPFIVGDTGTSSPHLEINAKGDVAFGSTGTSTFAGNTTFAGTASTTELIVSGTCNGCGTTYTGSSTAYSVSSGTKTHTGSIPTNANMGIGTYNINNSSDTVLGSFTIMRQGLTSVVIDTTFSASDADYTFTFSGNDFVVQETGEGGTHSVSGIMYWYR